MQSSGNSTTPTGTTTPATLVGSTEDHRQAPSHGDQQTTPTSFNHHDSSRDRVPLLIVQAGYDHYDPDLPHTLTGEEIETISQAVYHFLASRGIMARVYATNWLSNAPTLTWIVEYHDIGFVMSALSGTGTSHSGGFTRQSVRLQSTHATNLRSHLHQGINIWSLFFVPSVDHLGLAVVDPGLAVSMLPPGTSHGATMAQLYERAMVYRMAPRGTGVGILADKRTRIEQLPPSRHLDFCNTFADKPMYMTGTNITNAISIARIREGQDVRTTVMIRNIPNAITLEDLIRLLNDIVPGLFDFVYLRIDFTNGHNVGYGFVNFILAEYIILLIEAVAFRRW